MIPREIFIIPAILVLVALAAFFTYNPATPTSNVIPQGYGAVNNSQFQLENG